MQGMTLAVIIYHFWNTSSYTGVFWTVLPAKLNTVSGES
jgi:hypothetical protein